MAYKGAAVIGIDIGTNDSIIAYVGKAMVDIVQNEVSQRKTPSLVGFNDRERLLGDSAQTVVKSNLKNSCRNFRHIMGPASMCEEQKKKEDFWGLAPFELCDDGTWGYKVLYMGEERIFSTTQIAAMYLTKMKETAEAWCQARVNDVVISVPSYYNDFQRQAMVDAAQIAGLNVLRLMNEHTATALAYGIYRVKDFSPETPIYTAFGHMGHSSFSISIVAFYSDRLVVISEESSTKCGGRDMDEILMRYFAGEFKKKFGCDPLTSKKALLKLEEASSKCKKILSANDQAPISIECLMEDEDLSGSIKRDDFIALCEPMKVEIERVIDCCVNKAKKEFAGELSLGIDSVEDVKYVEIIGGACRVPFFQDIMSKKFVGKELSKTLNADECVARGCALQAAMLSPLYKVRDFKVEDHVPYSISFTWQGSSNEDHDGDDDMDDGEKTEKTQTKQMVVFKESDKMDTKKYVTWQRNGPFELGVGYTDSENATGLGQFLVEMPASQARKKVKIEAKVSLHGVFGIESAALVETEEYDEIVKEKREIVTPEAPEGEEKKENEAMPDASEAASEETKTPEKKYEWVEVKKPKKRTKRTPLNVVSKTPEVTPGLVDAKLANYKDVESKLQSQTREVKENDRKRNDLETYIYGMREKIVNDGGKCSAYLQSALRETFRTQLTAAEDWLYDHFDASTAELCEKLAELESVGNPVLTRYQNHEDLKEHIPKFTNALSQIRTTVMNNSEEFAHIAAEKKQEVMKATEDAEMWFNQAQQKENARELYEDATLSSRDLMIKEKELVDLAKKVMSEPKPAPPVVEETKGEESMDTTETAAANEEESKQEVPSTEEKEAPTMEVD